MLRLGEPGWNYLGNRSCSLLYSCAYAWGTVCLIVLPLKQSPKLVAAAVGIHISRNCAFYITKQNLNLSLSLRRLPCVILLNFIKFLFTITLKGGKMCELEFTCISSCQLAGVFYKEDIGDFTVTFSARFWYKLLVKREESTEIGQGQ